MTQARRIAIDLTSPHSRAQSNDDASVRAAAFELLGGIAERHHQRELLVWVDPSQVGDVRRRLGTRPRVLPVYADSVPPGSGSDPGSAWPPTWSLSRALGADVLLCPLGDGRLAESGVPTVVVIPDVQVIDRPHDFEPAIAAERRRALERTVGVADRLVCASEFTRDRLVEQFALDRDRTATIPLPLRDRWERDGSDIADRVRQLGLRPGEYVLYPAANSPEKNHRRLIDAYHRYATGIPGGIDGALTLVCAGIPASELGVFEYDTSTRGLDAKVVFRTMDGDDDLEALVRGSRALLVPSLYEGFGAVLQEAMAARVAVAVANRTCLPELVGTGGLLFDPTDISQIADALRVLHEDDERVRELAQLGYERSRDLDPSDGADAYVRLLDDVVSTASPGRSGGPAAPTAFSVVIPSYEQAEFIERTITSVLTQGVEQDVMVRDGGSTDGTVEILERYTNQLRFVSQPDGGQADAVNQGIADTTGDVIAWINSDDIWYEGALELAAEVLSRHPDLDGVYFAANHIDAEGAVLNAYPSEPWNAAGLAAHCFVCQPATFFRRRVFERIGPLDDRLRYCMDLEYWIRLSAVTALVYVPIVVAGSRLHGDTKTLAHRVEALAEINDVLHRSRAPIPDGRFTAWTGAVVGRRRLGKHNARDERRAAWALRRAAVVASVRWRTVPPVEMRSLFRPKRRGTPRASAAAKSRTVMASPYHFMTRWVRRRTMWELEPRLAAIESQLAAIERALDVSWDQSMLAEREVTSAEVVAAFERFAERQEALLRVVTDELSDLRNRVDGGGPTAEGP